MNCKNFRTNLSSIINQGKKRSPPVLGGAGGGSPKVFKLE